MKKVGFALLVGLAAMVIATGLTIFQPSVQAASLAKGQVEIELIIGPGTEPAGVTVNTGEVIKAISNTGEFVVDSFFDITYASNIGSSGLDGVTVGSFAVDSFFDITYSMFDTEMVALSLSAALADPDKPGEVIDTIKKALEGVGKVYYGHITVLK